WTEKELTTLEALQLYQDQFLTTKELKQKQRDYKIKERQTEKKFKELADQKTQDLSSTPIDPSYYYDYMSEEE
ncbi:MAG: hypothetical protein ACRDDY_19820, partial [Clostridium sp.]|uniref:hypothetical protein n=1 Tax=Clostridium sp. TaxID=1506 RepID=UPI003EE60BA9